jgi:hypothetical protein
MSEQHQDFTVKSNARRAAKKLGLDPASVGTIIKAGKKIYRLPLTAKPAKAAKPKTIKATKPKAAKAANPKRERKTNGETGTKFVAVAAMLRKPGGAAISAICKETGWLPHTARARISKDVSKLLDKGEKIERSRPDKGGESHYAIVPDKQLSMPGV